MTFTEASARLVATGLAVLTISCAWVSADPGSEEIALITASHAASCKKIGRASANTKDSALFFTRNEKTMDNELLILGRNEAAKIGGDALVAIGEPIDGRQEFEVYRCR